MIVKHKHTKQKRSKHKHTKQKRTKHKHTKQKRSKHKHTKQKRTKHKHTKRKYTKRKYKMTEIGDNPVYLPVGKGYIKLTGIISCFGIIAIIRTPIPEDENNDDEEDFWKIKGLVGWHFLTLKCINDHNVLTEDCKQKLNKFKSLVQQNSDKEDDVEYYLYLSTPPNSTSVETADLGFIEEPKYRIALEILNKEFPILERIPSTEFHITI